MNHTLRTFLVALSLAGVTAPAAQAAPQRGPTATSSSEALSPQERELLTVAYDFARQCSDTMERWIASKEVSEDQLLSFLYYPQPKTDPPKFSTDWDRLSDRDIQNIEEAVLARSPAILFAVLVDKNGYLPTHNRKFSQPLTGNGGVDLVNNRTKRIFDDLVGISAARNEGGFLLQRYQRDTGEVLTDLSVPVVVRGKHFGAVRIGFRALDGK
jgi:methyl-accepting chemotaxis protein